MWVLLPQLIGKEFLPFSSIIRNMLSVSDVIFVCRLVPSQASSCGGFGVQSHLRVLSAVRMDP